MDADTRHQLKQNELAEALARLRDFSDRRTAAWLAVILVIALGYAGYKFWRWQQRVQVVESYQTLASAGTGVVDASLGDAPLAQLRQLIADNSQPGLVALSRLQLAQGLEARGQTAETASKLTEAETQYQAILDMPEAPKYIKAAAVFRLGMLYETRREFDRARETYTGLSEDARFAGSPFIELATQRLEQLDRLALPIDFEPGVRPLPAAPATQMATPTTDTTDVPAAATEMPVAPTTQPAASEDAADTEPTGQSSPSESREPQQP